MRPSTRDVSLRQLAGVEDFHACYELQRTTWGMAFEGLVAPSVLKIVPRTGGIVAGAFDVAGELLGFVLGWTGVRPAGSRRAAAPPPPAPVALAPAAPAAPEGIEVFHWSHMLAVAAAARDLGLGRRLKIFQRNLLQPLGVGTMEWTYDPLEARNAHLNLNVLGATVVEYVEDMYKGEAGSDLARGLGTDRFIVSWRVRGTAHEPTAEQGASRAADLRVHFDGAPCVAPAAAGAATALPDDRRVLVEVPANVQELKEADPALAAAYRAATRRAFEHYLGQGYAVAGFFRDGAGRAFYAVERGEV